MIVSVLNVDKNLGDELVLEFGRVKLVDTICELLKEGAMLAPHANHACNGAVKSYQFRKQLLQGHLMPIHRQNYVVLGCATLLRTISVLFCLIIFAKIEVVSDFVDAQGGLLFEGTPSIGSRLFQRCRGEVWNATTSQCVTVLY